MCLWGTACSGPFNRLGCLVVNVRVLCALVVQVLSNAWSASSLPFRGQSALSSRRPSKNRGCEVWCSSVCLFFPSVAWASGVTRRKPLPVQGRAVFTRFLRRIVWVLLLCFGLWPISVHFRIGRRWGPPVLLLVEIRPSQHHLLVFCAQVCRRESLYTCSAWSLSLLHVRTSILRQMWDFSVFIVVK